MPQLDEADSFRSGYYDKYEGVNAASTNANNSIYQYSHSLVQNNKDRLRIEQQREKHDTVKAKENVETTISEDLGDGQIAKLDASLKLLQERDPKLLIPSDILEDDEIHIVVSDKGNHELQDYQMQLMLLEQQNKKRLLTTRLEREVFLDTSLFRFDQVAATKEFARRYGKCSIGKQHTQAMGAQRPSQDNSSIQHAPRMPTIDLDTASDPSRKRQKHSHGPQSQSIEVNDHDTLNGSDSNAAQAPPVEGMPVHVDLLYIIACDHDRSRNHPVPAFRDAPTDSHSSTQRSRSHHLNGKIPVYDLEAFMENDTDDIAFVLLRTVQCSEASIAMARAGNPLRWTEDILVKSKILKNALSQIATCHFQSTPQSQEAIQNQFGVDSSLSQKDIPKFLHYRIVPTELFFYHHHSLLRTYALDHSESKKHVDALLEYVDNRYGIEFAEAESLFARSLVNQACLSHLFRPNTLVVSGTYGRPVAFVLQDWPWLASDGWVTLVCWSFQTDGSGFARKRSILSIPPIDSETRRIQDLAAFPLPFASHELRELLRSRGEKQWELRIPTQITYKGWNVKGDQFLFMIDHRIYHKMHESAQAFRFERPKGTHPFDRMPAYLNIDQEPSDVSFLLMSPDVHGFYLNEKKWIKLFVDCVRPVSWNKKAYERLVLPPQTKDLIRALVTVRTSQRGVKQGLGVAGKRTDITNGKGNGLIMLLHGGPGTGKTLTGESVAEIAEMPLYRVTCGDIGTNAEAVETYLNTVLHLGKTWNCVLLLDEADIFLEERSMADLKRNSLVSVFLRILEYYDGILILTSNRVGIFDEAFKSRIQVALHYENLNRSTRKKIWQNFLDMLEEDEEDVNFDEIKFHLDELAGKELNGRQIRNVLTTARQLAIFREERLDWKHLEQALAVSSNFNEYLKKLPGHTDDQRARDIGIR